MSVYDDNSLSIGNTPLVKLNHLTKGLKATVVAKVEGRNPAYSVKCRIGANMIWDAEKKGLLKPGGKIVEPTSGNTGIALAYVAAARGYELTITMPESMSIERRKILTVLGANVVLTPASGGMKAAIEKAAEIAASDSSYFMPQQFRNPANPEIHYKTTGPEIWEATDGKVDVLVSGVGTGGTISGAGKYLKEKNPDLIAVAVEPTESPVITQTLNGEELVPGPHKIQGIGAGFIPDTLNLDIVDRVEQVTSEDALEMGRQLASKEGLLSGISCGAATVAALRLAALDEFAGKTIVVVLPDAGERYLSSTLFDGVFSEDGLKI